MIGRQTICVFGIAGVGKTALIQAAITGYTGVLHVQASTLIKQGLSDPDVTSEALRKASGNQVLANQRVLITMFEKVVPSHPDGIVIFDGHLLIDTDTELVEIPLETIAAINPGVMIHVEAPAEVVADRRRRDAKRVRPLRSVDVLSEHQQGSRALCNQYASALGVEAVTIADGSPDQLRPLLRRH